METKSSRACRCTRKRRDLRWGETGRFLPSSLGSPAPSCALAPVAGGYLLQQLGRVELRPDCRRRDPRSDCAGAAVELWPRRPPDGAARCYGARRLAGPRMLTPWTRGGPAHGRVAELTRLAAASGSRARPPSAVRLGLPAASARRPVVPRTPRSQPWTRRRKAVHLG